MWTTDQTQLDARAHRYSIRSHSGSLSLRQWLGLTATDDTFRSYFNGILAASPFGAYFFETPPATCDSLDAPFEWVLIESDGLQRMRPDTQAFAEHFEKDALAVRFANLGGDSLLIAPTPDGDPNTHVHLANFARGASPRQLDYFWQLVASEFERSLKADPRWLSTSGLGIGWLHVRIDRHPKYYHHAEYTAPR
jgi:hypothetical protein